jgi:chemotaxis protein MotB
LQTQLEAATAEGQETEASLQAQLAEQATRIALLERELSASQVDRTTLSSLEAQLSQALIRVSEANALEARLEELRAENAALSSDLGGSEQETAELQGIVEALRQALADAQAEAAARTESEQTLEQRLAAAFAQQSAVEASLADTRDQLAAALAAKIAAETSLEDRLSDAEQRQLLLEQARSELDVQTQRATEAQRQTELLNQQVGALRRQLSSLQSLLDEATARDVEAKIQLESLGSELNSALARVAAEERRRRQLEEAERIRLEEERQRLEAEKQRLAGENQDLEQYRSEFFGRLREVLGNREGVRIEGDRFVFSSEVLFPSAQASLSIEGRVQVANVAAILRDVSRDIPDGINWIIRVDGHTDNVPLSGQGLYADNWELSQARALSVVRYMIEDLGIPPRRLSANGFGEYQPITTDDTAEARAQNRRIELKLTEQ